METSMTQDDYASNDIDPEGNCFSSLKTVTMGMKLRKILMIISVKVAM